MKFSFEEKKKSICIMAVIIFAIIAGVVYFVGHYDTAEGKMGEDGIEQADNGEGQIDDSKVSASETCDSEDGISKESESGYQDFEDQDIDDVSSELNPDGDIIVHVCGAVTAPGIYRISSNARAADAVEAAGGFLESADRDYQNLARILSDGEKLVIYTRKQTKKMSEDGQSGNMDGTAQTGVHGTEKEPGYDTGTGSSTKYVNINTASAEELMTLPGIGQSKADAIIAFREENGGFKAKEDLMQITGIKEGVYSKIEKLIVVK